MRAVVLSLLGVLAATAARAEDPAPLKPGPGNDVASTVCNACHTSNYIIMNSPFLPAAAWKAEVAKMRTAFGAPLGDEMAARVSDYLAANYAAPPKS